MKNYFHNDSFLGKLRHSPAEPLSEKDYRPIEAELKRLTQKAGKTPEIAINIVDYHIVKDNIQEVYGMRLPKRCKFIVGVKYGDNPEKYITVMNEGLEKQSVEVTRYRVKDVRDCLQIRLFVTKFTG